MKRRVAEVGHGICKNRPGFINLRLCGFNPECEPERGSCQMRVSTNREQRG
jgi:hypothetical protein